MEKRDLTEYFCNVRYTTNNGTAVPLLSIKGCVYIGEISKYIVTDRRSGHSHVVKKGGRYVLWLRGLHGLWLQLNRHADKINDWKINVPCSAWTVGKFYLSSINIDLNTVWDLVLSLTSMTFCGDVYCLLNDLFQHFHIMNISLAEIFETSLLAFQRNFTIKIPQLEIVGQIRLTCCTIRLGGRHLFRFVCLSLRGNS